MVWSVNIQFSRNPIGIRSVPTEKSMSEKVTFCMDKSTVLFNESQKGHNHYYHIHISQKD